MLFTSALTELITNSSYSKLSIDSLDRERNVTSLLLCGCVFVSELVETQTNFVCIRTVYVIYEE